MNVGDVVTVDQAGEYFTGKVDFMDDNGSFGIKDVLAVYADGTTKQFNSTPGFIFDSKEVKITTREGE